LKKKWKESRDERGCPCGAGEREGVVTDEIKVTATRRIAVRTAAGVFVRATKDQEQP